MQLVMTLAVSLSSPPGPGILHHHGYCEINVWVEFWFGFAPLPTAAWPLALPTFCTALMVVVMSLPAPVTVLLLLPMLTAPRFWPPTLMPASAHCPLWVIPVAWSPELAELVPVALPW